jgi:tRNA G18 (ribose-2'-O)-methylase SpoU
MRITSFQNSHIKNVVKLHTKKYRDQYQKMVIEGPFKKMAYQNRPEGLLAVAPQLHHALDRHPVAVSGLYIIAEALEKPGNLGSILRSADAAGVDGVIVCDPCTDVWPGQLP